MNTLTGNRDTDISIILALNLKDMNKICRVNKYTKELCHTDRIINKLNKIKENVEYLINLKETYYETNEIFEPFLLFMNNIRIWIYSIELRANDVVHLGTDDYIRLYKDYPITSITIKKLTMYEIIYYYNVNGVNKKKSFNCNKDQVRKFLTTFLYDELIYPIL